MTNVSTWGELQPLVRAEGFDLSSLLAAENINKSDLVNDLAVLPATDFRLFLRPKQTKSGTLDRKECFAAIKIYLVNHPQDKAKFTVDGKNVTQLTTAVVQDLVAKYVGGLTSESSTTRTTTTSETIKEVKYSTPARNSAEVDETELTDIERIEEALTLISTLEGYPSYYKVLKHLGRLRFEVSPEMEESEEENELAREARELGY